MLSFVTFFPGRLVRDFLELSTYPILQREEALTLVTAAISAGIFNDLGSGSNVDACVITAQGTEELRNFVKPNERVEKERRQVFLFSPFGLSFFRFEAFCVYVPPYRANYLP